MGFFLPDSFLMFFLLFQVNLLQFHSFLMWRLQVFLIFIIRLISAKSLLLPDPLLVLALFFLPVDFFFHLYYLLMKEGSELSV